MPGAENTASQMILFLHPATLRWNGLQTPASENLFRKLIELNILDLLRPKRKSILHKLSLLIV